MRLPDPSPWQYLGGLGWLVLAYGLAVGSGMNLKVEHDREHLVFLGIAAMLTVCGGFLLWLALRDPSRR